MGLVFESLCYDWLVLGATVIIAAYFYAKSKLRYFSDRDIPYIKPTFMDHVMSIINLANLIEHIGQVYDRAKDEPYSGFFQILTPTFMVRDPEILQKIMIKDFSHFQNHGFEFNEKGNPLDSGHLFNMKGDKWRLLRYKLAPTFTSGKLKAMLPYMEESADKVIHDMKLGKYGFEDVLVKTLYREYSIKAIATCAFGVDGESVSDPNCEFRKILDRVFRTPSAIDIMKTAIRLVSPSLSKVLQLKITPKEVDDFFIALTKESFEVRKKTGIKRNDFIQLLLELKEKGSIEIDSKDLEDDERHILDKPQPLNESGYPSEKLEFTDELLCAQIFIFWVAGYENASVTLAMVSYLLSKNVNVQERLRKEVKDMKEKHGGMNYSALKDMELLEACISESLRMYPPVPVLFRKCNKDYTMDDGKKIENGRTVIIPVKSFQNDPKYWTNPQKFNPDRFLQDGVVPGSYMPFGDGPRICIAQRFAQLQTKIMLAKLIESFELIYSHKTKEPLTFDRLSINPVGGLWATLKKVN